MQRITQLPPLPPRPIDGHKGLFGRVLVIGGNQDMIGAPVLAGTAALRMGSGLVQIAVSKQNLAASISITPELIGLGLDATVASTKRLLESAVKADVLIVGPGLGVSPLAGKRIEALIRMDKAMVIDADALNYLAGLKKWPAKFRAKAVLTPHPGEMKRLAKLLGIKEVPADDAGRIDLALRAAKAWGQVVVLKGHCTVVSDGDHVYLNRTGNSALAKGGSGDVLSGIIGSLIGQGASPFDAAVSGCWLLGRAGDGAAEEYGIRGVLARDVIDDLPNAIDEYEQAAGYTTPI